MPGEQVQALARNGNPAMAPLQAQRALLLRSVQRQCPLALIPKHLRVSLMIIGLPVKMLARCPLQCCLESLLRHLHLVVSLTTSPREVVQHLRTALILPRLLAHLLAHLPVRLLVRLLGSRPPALTQARRRLPRQCTRRAVARIFAIPTAIVSVTASANVTEIAKHTEIGRGTMIVSAIDTVTTAILRTAGHTTIATSAITTISIIIHPIINVRTTTTTNQAAPTIALHTTTITTIADVALSKLYFTA